MRPRLDQIPRRVPPVRLEQTATPGTPVGPAVPAPPGAQLMPARLLSIPTARTSRPQRAAPAVAGARVVPACRRVHQAAMGATAVWAGKPRRRPAPPATPRTQAPLPMRRVVPAVSVGRGEPATVLTSRVTEGAAAARARPPVQSIPAPVHSW